MFSEIQLAPYSVYAFMAQQTQPADFAVLTGCICVLQREQIQREQIRIYVKAPASEVME